MTIFLRRILLPALLGGILSNIAVYWMLGAEDSPFTDWKSMGLMSAIALVGLIVGGLPALRLLDRARLPAAVRVILLLVAGVLVGGVLAFVIASFIVDEGQTDYVKFGLAAGLAGAAAWLVLNFDRAVGAPRRRSGFS